MKYLQNFVAENEETLTFDVNNLSHSLVNAIRRLIISDVETIAFRTEYGKQSDIVIHKNTSSLHNEFLANRISLVPIHVPSSQIQDFNPDKYEFFIKEQNNSSSSMDITTEHIQIRDVTKSTPTLLSKTACRGVPPSKITGDYILLILNLIGLVIWKVVVRYNYEGQSLFRKIMLDIVLLVYLFLPIVKIPKKYKLNQKNVQNRKKIS